jgi:hypothetical protein
LQPPPKRKNGKKENYSEGGNNLSNFRFRDAPDSPLFVQVLDFQGINEKMGIRGAKSKLWAKIKLSLCAVLFELL